MIPKLIIQTWKDNNVPEKYRELLKKIRENNKEFNYMFYTDENIKTFMENHYPEYVGLFNQFQYPIQRIDFFRYLVIYKYGGFYFDLDMDIDRSLDTLLENEVVFPKEWQKNGDPILQEQNMPFLLGNYAFGACAGNLFLKKIIDNIVSGRIPREKIPNKKDKIIFYTTGPVLVTQSLIDYNLIPNVPNITILEPTPKFFHARFGNYGSHKMMGSWK